MQRQVCWIERLEDGTKREVRVGIHGGAVKWQFKLSTDERWDYDTPPSVADWSNLLERMENRYQRRNVAYGDLERVRSLRQAALEHAGNGGPEVLGCGCVAQPLDPADG